MMHFLNPKDFKARDIQLLNVSSVRHISYYDEFSTHYDRITFEFFDGRRVTWMFDSKEDAERAFELLKDTLCITINNLKEAK